MGRVLFREIQPDEDEAYEIWRQRQVDGEDDRPRQPAPIPQACHDCGHHYAGIICPLCKTERPAWTAMKKLAPKAA